MRKIDAGVSCSVLYSELQSFVYLATIFVLYVSLPFVFVVESSYDNYMG